MMANGRIILRDTLEGLLAAHRCVVIRLPALQTPRNLPGVVSATSAAGEWQVICQETREGFLGALRAAGGQVMSESEPSLEDIFHAHVAGSGTDAEAAGDAREALQRPQPARL